MPNPSGEARRSPSSGPSRPLVRTPSAPSSRSCIPPRKTDAFTFVFRTLGSSLFRFGLSACQNGQAARPLFGFDVWFYCVDAIEWVRYEASNRRPGRECTCVHDRPGQGSQRSGLPTLSHQLSVCGPAKTESPSPPPK